jgi:squalene-hopene/tetraprenyl-beta-curcumene cyclase
MKRAAQWLLSIQNEDGGWGESGDSYKLEYRGYERRRARHRKRPGPCSA